MSTVLAGMNPHWHCQAAGLVTVGLFARADVNGGNGGWGGGRGGWGLKRKGRESSIPIQSPHPGWFLSTTVW